MTDLSLLRVLLFCKDVIKEVRNVNEIVFFLENKYLPHNEERGTFAEDIPGQECLFAFEESSNFRKAHYFHDTFSGVLLFIKSCLISLFYVFVWKK